MKLSRRSYYTFLLDLAREKRASFNVRTDHLGLAQLRSIYRQEGIKIDLRKLSSGLKGIYMCHDGEISVAIRKDLPDEPKIFAMAHELKHHWVDQDKLLSGAMQCGDYNANELEEKGAEVFAAEFVYPEEEFAADITRSGITVWDGDAVVVFKREFCRGKVSYTFIRKRLEWLGLLDPEEVRGFKFRGLSP